MTTEPTTRTESRAAMLVPLFVFFLVTGIAVALVMPFLSLFLSTEVAAGPAQITVFLILAPLSGVAASTVMGRLSDRGPIRRRLMIISALTGIAGCAATAVVRNYWILLVLAVTAIALSGTLFPQTLAYARQWLAREMPDRAAMGMSTLRTVMSAAWVAGPPLGAFLIAAGGFRLVYAVSTVLYAVAAVVVIFRLTEVEPLPPGTAEADDEPPSRWVLWLSAAAFVCLQAPLTLGAQSLPFLTSRDLGGDVQDAGLVLGLCALLEIPLMLALGALVGRVRLRPMVLAGAGVGVAYYAVATTAGNVGVLLAAQVLNAVFIAAVAGLGITYMQEMLPRSPGRSTTLFTNTFPLGAMLSGPLIGLGQQYGARVAFGLCGVLCLLGLGLLSVVRPRPAA